MSDCNRNHPPGMSEADTSGFTHFMLKEIYEQSTAVQRCLTAYHQLDWCNTQAPGISPFNLNLPDTLYRQLAQVQVVACGTSRHAGLVGQYWLEQMAGIPTRVRSASEFVSAPLPLVANTLTIAITQSGETADTLAAVATERDRQSSQNPSPSWLLGITNQPESALANLVDFTLPTLAGAEIGVAATKTFLTQLVVLYCLALDLAFRQHRLTAEALCLRLAALESLPEILTTLLEQEHESIRQLAVSLAAVEDCVVIGRGVNRAIALEGALKLKETTYIHAEGYAGGEFMHGPIAMLDETVPVIVIAPAGSVYDRIIANARTIKANGTPLIGITNTLDGSAVFDHWIKIPAIEESLSPLLTVVPLQLLAYEIAVERGLNVDRPRHITKTLSG